jgi:hypothetical protein
MVFCDSADVPEHSTTLELPTLKSIRDTFFGEKLEQNYTTEKDCATPIISLESISKSRRSESLNSSIV